MKRTAHPLSPALFLIMFSSLILPMLQTAAAAPGSADTSFQVSSAAADQKAPAGSGLENMNLIEGSAFSHFFNDAKDKLDQFGQQLSFVFSSYPAVPSEVANALNHLTGGKGLGQSIKILLLFLLPFAIGFGVEKTVNIPINKFKHQLQSTIPKSILQLSVRLSARTGLELVSFSVFAVVTVGVFLLFYPTQSPPYELALVYLPPIFFMRLASIVLCALYSPATPHLRITPQNCRSAAMYMIGFMTFIIITLFASKTLWLLKSHGLSDGVFLLLYSHLGMLQFIILLTMVWMDRTHITHSIEKKRNRAEAAAPSSGNRLARLWFPLTCLALLGFELLWQINWILYRKDLVLPLLLTILSIPFGLLLFSIGNRLLLIAAGRTELMDPRIVNQDIITEGMDLSAYIKVELPPEPVSSASEDEAANQKASLFLRNLSLIRKLMGMLIACALFFWVMNLWGLDLPLGRSIVHSATSIFSTILMAYVVWEICRSVIDRKLEEGRPQSADMEDMEEGAEGSRKGTLLTLLRKVILALIAVVVVLTSLNAIGINIGPLLAGAGILGLAVGFGSQTLVRDILSGVFFLMDDAFRVGDYIETAGTKGMVEHISLRSLRLRHPRGMVYTIPFGDMGSVQNFSRDYIITKLDVRVRYDADIEKIRKIIKKISNELEKDDETGQLLLSKIKSQGVREMDDSAMIVRVKFKTKPGDQFVLRREVYRRIQERFRAQGIEFAHRNVTVYLPPEVTGAPGGNGEEDETAPGGMLDKKLVGAGGAAAIAASQLDEAKN